MLRIRYTGGNPLKYYKVSVSVTVGEESGTEDFALSTKVPEEAIYSALRASLKDTYTLHIDGPYAKNPTTHCEVENLDTLCRLLGRMRWYSITYNEVPKTILITKIIETEL